MVTNRKKGLDEILSYMPELTVFFSNLSASVKDRICEIRLRVGSPCMLELTGPNQRMRLDKQITGADLETWMQRFCSFSIHSFTHQIAEGYVTIKGGHRIGFCGTAVLKQQAVENIREITSMNIRIAKAYLGCSDMLFRTLNQYGDAFRGLLLIGSPMSAKTTMLRDLVRNFSAQQKIVILDERGEIAAKHNGVFAHDIGENTDVLDAFPKSSGFIHALRSLSPDIIACDEIGQDSAVLEQCVNCGVKLLITAHCASIEELYRSRRYQALMRSKGISHIALLGNGKELGRVKQVYSAEFDAVENEGRLFI